ncbi:MAG: UvrD-helicase domain-containing protein [Pseudomonadota bacterium]
MVADAAQRAEALDVTSSFCVTAPAGSGKTELLIQRVLALLARVERPEQVLAVTFTRKAAAEMRERIAHALEDALNDAPCDEAHQQVTRRLAAGALAASQRLGWHLQRDLSRLQIKTIDSFCAGLTRQMPILSAFGGQPQALDSPETLYEEAVSELLSVLGTERAEADDLAELLLHFDNNSERLRELLISLLWRRDQWLPYIGATQATSEQALEHVVAAVVGEVCSELDEALGHVWPRLLPLWQYSLKQRGKAAPETLPAPGIDHAGLWRDLPQLLLTADNQWRRSVDKRNGFPPGEGAAKDKKDAMLALLADLAGEDALARALAMVRLLPDKGGQTRTWEVARHLSRVLPLLSAFLLVVFQQRGQVDHSQVAQSALQALGDEEAPTDLALRLDYRIEHILVDEFQDTALNQYRLVERLTHDWGSYNQSNPEAPRTLFIVGDGMQSIYGFRDANVGLFKRAAQQGFNGVELKPITLSCNFRSQAGLVAWFNETFRDAFPAQDNARLGEVAFHDAEAVQAASEMPAVRAHAFTGDDAGILEARFIASEVESLQGQASVRSIAILGRTRAQLAAVIVELNIAGVPFAAQDIGMLRQSAPVVDLLSLCRALANPADRVAWFALLRAPFCGLGPEDLLALGQQGDPSAGTSPWQLLDSAAQAGLTPDGLARVSGLADALGWAWRQRDRLALRVWLEQLWLRLGGPAAYASASAMQDAKVFFLLLQRADEEGLGLDIHWLQQQLDKLFAQAADPEAKLQVMTLHKAKGLEFDRVFIPGLARAARSDDRGLLLWEQYESPQGELGFLLAADDHSKKTDHGLYNFLRVRDAHRARLEQTRLLYVGATRAIQQLVLTACLTLEGEADWQPGASLTAKQPARGSLVAPIWPAFSRLMVLHEPVAAEQSESVGQRLRLESPPTQERQPGTAMLGESNVPERHLNYRERYVGTAVHRALEVLAQHALPATLEKGSPEVVLLQRELSGLGLSGEALASAVESALLSVQCTLLDATGRWILDSGHDEAFCELSLTIAHPDGSVQDIVIDRTFVDAATGERWIIDYKTSRPSDNESLEAFCEREAKVYLEQLETYRYALSQESERVIRCALYFTRVGHLHEVEVTAAPA